MPKQLKKNTRPIRLLSDQAINEGGSTREDGLGFDAYAETLANAAIGTPGPFTIGVFGDNW